MSQGGVLVTNVQAEKNKKEQYLIKPSWQKHFTPDQWENLGQDGRESFLLKQTIAEMMLDMSSCLIECVESSSKRKY